jgi:transcriptional regulator with XRE-family HTH domain
MFFYEEVINMSTLAERLKSLRKEKDVRQEDVSKSTGIHVASLSRYENGKRVNIGRDELIKLANYYGVSLDYIAGISTYKESISLREIENIFNVLPEGEKLLLVDYAKYLYGRMSKNEGI